MTHNNNADTTKTAPKGIVGTINLFILTFKPSYMFMLK